MMKSVPLTRAPGEIILPCGCAPRRFLPNAPCTIPRAVSRPPWCRRCLPSSPWAHASAARRRFRHDAGICYGPMGVSVFDFLNRLAYTLFLTAKAFATPVAFGANAAVFDAEGRVLLVRHSYRRGWHFPGGGVARGEAPEVAVRRELSEEIGLTGGDWSLIGIYTQPVWWVSNVVAFYRVENAQIDF